MRDPREMYWIIDMLWATALFLWWLALILVLQDGGWIEAAGLFVFALFVAWFYVEFRKVRVE